jgi:Protein of unknown function (DUF3313)
MKTRFSVVLFVFLFWAVTAWAEGKTIGTPPNSGFLKSTYSKLRASQEHEGLWLYVEKSKDFKAYKKLFFEPVKVYNPPYLTGSSVSPEVLYDMRHDMLSTLTQAFAPGFELVQQPGPGVLRFSVSVYGVEMVKPDWQLGDNLPVKKALDLVTGGKVVPVMTAEMEVFDAEGHSVTAAVVMRKGEKEIFKGDKLTWDELQPIVSYWAQGLRQGLDQLQGNTDRVTTAN